MGQVKSLSKKAPMVMVAAIAVALLLDWDAFLSLTPVHWTALGLLVVLGLLSEYLSIPIVVGSNKGSHSITFLLLYASVFLFGPAATLVASIATYSIGEPFLRRKDPLRALFNVSQHSLGCALGGVAFVYLGGVNSPDRLVFNPLPFAAMVMTWSLTNLLVVAWAYTDRSSVRFWRVLTKMAGKWGGNLLYDLLVLPVAVIIAWGYAEFGMRGLFLTIFPLLLIRRSYLTNYQLQQANRSLLKALVKAIETRDPYTSGHSVRVADLASRVAHGLNLSNRAIEHIETAALLHDVGKIDIIYSDILKKKGSLSDKEMEIIKSHVDKGVELLRSLGSFPNDVIAAVRHHHERYDGSGYPDGIVAKDIPLGARIIKICDAVDAMLSDRPYRKALSLPDVREQLLLFAEREFDPVLVSVFFKAGLLEDHASTVRGDDVEFESLSPVPRGTPRRRPTTAPEPAG